MTTEDKPAEVIAEVVEPEPVKLTKYEKAELAAHDRIRSVEDEMLEKSQNIVGDVLDFKEIEPGNEEQNEALKQRWSQEMGSRQAAEQRFRVALSGWANNANMPGAIKVAQEMYTGIIKARSKDGASVQVLNATFIQMPMPDSVLKMIEED